MASCSICADSYEDFNDICSTVCGHIFHLSCLELWQQRSDTCPICNRRNPEPHRIFLDIKGIVDSAKSSEEYNVVIKGAGINPFVESLSTTVMELIHIMKAPIKEIDIVNTSIIGNNIQVSFNTSHNRELFLRNKNKLKNNRQTSAIRIYEVLDAETEKLLHYSHKLKESGYKIIFAKNNKVYVKKENFSDPVNILSQNHVDSLCRRTTNTPVIRSNINRYPTREISRPSQIPIQEIRPAQEERDCTIL